jgi:adenosylcobinamide-GDP ribazoletransferase
VGWLVGIVGCVAFALLGGLPDSDYTPLAAAIGSTIATVLLTGSSTRRPGPHSGRVGRRQRRARATYERLAPRRLAHGCRYLARQVSLLAVLASRSPVAVLAALLAGHVLSRFWPLLLVRNMPYVGGGGTSESGPLAARIGSADLAIAAAWCGVAVGVALFAQGMAFAIISLSASGLALLAMQRLLARRLQGFTENGLGAIQQVCEIAFYLGAAVSLGVQ